jgi:peptidoglycan/xylan/chitin deacetylase (PgdA/CDA1 family)
MRFACLALCLALSILLPSLAPAAAFTVPGMEFLERQLSHMVPGLFGGLPPDPAGLPPPESLLSPLSNGNEEYTKGMEPAAETDLARSLLSLPLHQRLLKVAVATVDGRRLALVKLQAGDTKTGLFRISDLQYDAVNALRVAFELPLDLQQIDLWSVVPGTGREGPLHRPVFSVSADRASFELASNDLRPARDILGGLGLVRFAPQFLQYAGGRPITNVTRLLPETAWSTAPLSDNWEQLKRGCAQDPRLPAAALARVVVHIPVTDNSVALTIDDGPHPLIASLFLEILQRYGVKATFFVVGEKVEEVPELLRRIVDAGHEIGNHTYDHPRLRQLSDIEALAQIRGGALAIGKVSGLPTPLFRPPGGGLTVDTLRAATAANSTVVLWTHNTNDWLKPSPEEIAANALRDLKPGSIILMHQGSLESARALPLIIQGAQAKGLRLCTVGEMLRQAPVPVLPIPEIMTRYEKHLLEKE